MTITAFHMLWNDIGLLVSQVFPSHSTCRNLCCKCVSIEVYVHFLKFILLNCTYKFLMPIYAHLGVSIQHLFFVIFQNAHKSRWMET